MKQIQQHEWVDIAGRVWLSKCVHCSVIKHAGFKPKHLYRYLIGNWQQEEPKCITRPAKEAGENA